MFGWREKVLRVDLTRGVISQEPLDPAVARQYLGGRGLGAQYLLKHLKAGTDPLGPDNPLIMAVGPLTGTSAPTGGRYMVMTHSPLTGAITCSNSGGHFPTALKKAGWEMIVIEGASQKPVYLWIDGPRAELRSAAHLWGKTVPETDAALIAETHPQAKTACIGPAGENLVRFAAIMNDRHRAAGRSGVGAVMGAKRLKAVVARGDDPVPLAHPEEFKRLVSGLLKRFKEAYRDAPPPLRSHGTAITVAATQHYGVFPTRNFQQGSFEGWEKIHGETLSKRFLKRASACASCPIACGRVTKVDEAPYEGEGEGPEYETVYALGSNCGVDNLAALTKANYLCNELGLDTISMGGAIAVAMELGERGILPASKLGRVLRFGDAAALVELTRLTAYRQGLGDELAEGSLRFGASHGHPELAMVAKGQDFAGYDPRGEQGMGLAYATSPVGGSHMRGDPAYIELLGVPVLLDPLTHEDKPPIVRDWQDAFALIDAAGLCVFFSVRNLVTPTRDIRPQGIMELVNAATGAGYAIDEFSRVGERIFNAERLLLNRLGLDRASDTLPARITAEPLPGGPAKGQVCRLEPMLEAYYLLRGWDATGRPGPAKLRELGLA